MNSSSNPVLIKAKPLIPYLDAILTTNYDFSIEYTLFGEDKLRPNFETKPIGSYNSHKGYKFESDSGFKIYHIHGDLNHPTNICLGFLGYQRYLKSCTSNIKQDVSLYVEEANGSDKNESPESNFFKLLDNGIVKKKNSGSKDKNVTTKILPESLKYLLENDVYILGLNLSDSELILWYVLTIRKELIRYNKYEKENQKLNRIVYYDAVVISNDSNDKKRNEEIRKRQKANIEYYKNLNIEYECEELNSKIDYADFYIRKLNDILSKVKEERK